MTDPGIPIPQPPSPYYCVGCGDYHAPGNCPSLSASAMPAMPLPAAAEVAALRKKIEDIERARISHLETLENLIEHGKKVNERLDALEAAGKDPAKR